MATVSVLSAVAVVVIAYTGTRTTKRRRLSRNDMNVYQFKADCDWGNITNNAQVEATTFPTAFHRAARTAKRLARRNPKWIVIRVERIGKKVSLQEKSDKALDFINKAIEQELK